MYGARETNPISREAGVYGKKLGIFDAISTLV